MDKFYIFVAMKSPQLQKILGLVMFFCVGFCFAGPPSDPPPPLGPPVEPPGMPIDSSIYILVVAAISYGMYSTLRLSRNKKKAV